MTGTREDGIEESARFLEDKRYPYEARMLRLHLLGSIERRDLPEEDEEPRRAAARVLDLGDNRRLDRVSQDNPWRSP